MLPLAAYATTVSDITVNADGTLSKPDNFWAANASGMATALSGSFLTGLSGHNVSELTNDSAFITQGSWDSMGGTQSNVSLSGFTNDLSLSGMDGSGLTGVQMPLTAGTDYLSPTGDGSGLTGVQMPLTAGTDYLTPTGDGSGLSGVMSSTGDGSGLTGIPSDPTYTGYVYGSVLYGVTLETLAINVSNMNSASIDSSISSDGNGNLTAVSFNGDGSGLTGVVHDDSAQISTSGNGDILVLSVNTYGTPPAATDAGMAGSMIFSNDGEYRCFGTGDWRKLMSVVAGVKTYSTY